MRAHKGIAFTGDVCVSLGLLSNGRWPFSVEEEKLIKDLVFRCEVNREKAQFAIDWAIKDGVVKRKNGRITFIKRNKGGKR